MAEREEEQSIQKRKLRYWCYDDGSVAAALFNEENKASVELNMFDNIDKMELSYDLSQHPEWDVGQTEFSCGICGNKYDVFSAASLDSDQLRDGLYQLEQMLDAYAIRDNAQPLWELFSYIMAGYVSRLFDSQTKRHSLYFYRAPIVWLAGHKKDVCGGFEHIERFVDCLAVDTSRDAKLLFYNPAVIPTKRSVDNITDCAYIVRKKDKAQRRAPTQYRDTSVLIHPYFFENKDLADFIQRNRWATVLVFNKKIDDECTIINKVNLNDIALPEWEWQEEKISNLIEKYTQWLSLIQYQENYKKVWLLWDNMSEEILYRAELAKSVQKGKRIQGSERASKLLQIKALIAFIHFCKESSITDAAGARWLRENWLGKLLGVNKEHAIPILTAHMVCIFADTVDNPFPELADVFVCNLSAIGIVGTRNGVDNHPVIFGLGVVKTLSDLFHCGSGTLNSGRRPGIQKDCIFHASVGRKLLIHGIQFCNFCSQCSNTGQIQLFTM